MSTNALFGGSGKTTADTGAMVEDVTSEFSCSDSRITINGAFVSGNLVQVGITVKLTSALSAGGSITGTLETPYVPVTTICALTVHGGRAMAFFLRGNVQQEGSEYDPLTFVVRNLGASATSATAELTFGLLYIYDEVENIVEGEAIT